jgi:hypothetical protein
MTGLAGAVAMSRMARAQQAAAPSPLDAWLYLTPDGPGAFERDGRARWIERIPTGGQVYFEEKARTADYLELYDGGRRLWAPAPDLHGVATGAEQRLASPAQRTMGPGRRGSVPAGLPDSRGLLRAERSQSTPELRAEDKFEWAGGIARGAPYSADGGLGIFSAWVLQDAFCATSVQAQRKLLFDATPINGRVALGNGHPNSPRFQFIEDGFGAVAHELGHAFAAPHDLRGVRDIMGNGFRNMRASFANPPQAGKTANFSDDIARLLMSSRHLAADLDRTDNSPPQVALRIVSVSRDAHRASATVSVEASDEDGLRAVLFVLLDFGDLDRNSTVGGRWLTGKRQSFTHTLVFDPPSAREMGIEAYVTDQGGNLTRVVANSRL